MMRPRKDIFESKKAQWNNHLGLLTIKITELKVEAATREALLNQVQLIHKDISACNQASPHVYKKINDALDNLQGEIILLSLPAQTPEKKSDTVDANPFATLREHKKPAKSQWAFFSCCQPASANDDDTFEPKKKGYGA